VDLGYSVADGPTPSDTTVGLYWSKTADISGVIGDPVATQPIAAGATPGAYAPSHVAADALQNPPPGAAYLLAVVDPDNLVAESDKSNNVQALALPTLSPTLKWDDAGGVDVGYTINGDPGAQILADTRVDLYWSSSDKFADRLGDPIDSVDVPAGKEAGDNDAFPVSAATLGDPPDGATHLIAVADPDNVLGNFSEANNVQALALPLLTVKSATSPDPSHIRVTYQVEDGSLGSPFQVEVKRMRGSATEMDARLDVPEMDKAGHSLLTPGDHTVTLELSKPLKIDPDFDRAHPSPDFDTVQVTADPDHSLLLRPDEQETETEADFNIYTIGAVSVGTQITLTAVFSPQPER
jgi:hypothetical protein